MTKYTPPSISFISLHKIIHKITRYRNFTCSTIYSRIANCIFSVIYSYIYVQKWKVIFQEQMKQFLLSVTDPLVSVCSAWHSQPIGILKFKNGLEITNQAHILFGELLCTTRVDASISHRFESWDYWIIIVEFGKNIFNFIQNTKIIIYQIL